LTGKLKLDEFNTEKEKETNFTIPLKQLEVGVFVMW